MLVWGYLIVLALVLAWQINSGIAFGWKGWFTFNRKDAPVTFWITVAIEIALIIGVTASLLILKP